MTIKISEIYKAQMEYSNKLNSSGKQLVDKCQPGLCIRAFLQEKITLCIGHFKQLEGLIYDSKSGIPKWRMELPFDPSSGLFRIGLSASLN